LRGALGQYCIEILERIADVELAAKDEAIREAKTFRAKGNAGITARQRRLSVIIPGRNGFRGELYTPSIEHWEKMADHCERITELIASLSSKNGHALKS
jgi:hypothetical protein